MLNQRLMNSVDGFGDLMSRVYQRLHITGLVKKDVNFYHITPEELKELIKEMDKIPLEKLLDVAENYLSRQMKEDLPKNFKGSWLEYLNGLYDPKVNGFQLESVKGAYSEPNSREMFTEANCLLAEMETFQKAIHRNERGHMDAIQPDDKT